MKTTYKIDPAHSGAHFTVRHMMITNVRGSFKAVNGTVVYDPENPTASSIQAEIDAASISTNDEQRDAHLRSADFLDVEKFPTITYRSTKIERKGEGEWKVTGDLTIHGVTRPVVLDGGRAGSGEQGPVGQSADGRVGANEDQAQRIRTDLECGARSRRAAGWGRVEDRTGAEPDQNGRRFEGGITLLSICQGSFGTAAAPHDRIVEECLGKPSTSKHSAAR